MTKITIGTANFNQSYGIKKFKINRNEIKKILLKSKSNKIKLIDTAIDYNLSKRFLNSLDFAEHQIISKIKLPNHKKKQFIQKIPLLIEKEKKKFKVKNLKGILIHNIKDLLVKKYGEDFLKMLIEMKKKKLISKLGVSIYDPTDLDKLLRKFTPDIIQLPINIFDQRFLKNNILKKIKKKKNFYSSQINLFTRIVIKRLKKNKKN